MVSRLYLFAVVYLLNEVLGLCALSSVWLGSALGLGTGATRQDRLVNATYAVQRSWASVLFETARRLLGLRFEVEGDDAATRGPMLVFIQHSSILDTLVPTIFITQRHDIRLRFVLKRELLVSPCLDIAGHRLPNVFVDRSSTQTTQELDRIRALGRDLRANEGTLIYPEGTRFTAKKRLNALAKIETSQPGLHARASALVHVLPPRTGGSLALLEAAPEADCVFVGHRGLEGFAHYEDLLSGGLVGKVVRIRMWRVPRSAIPADETARVAWLYAQWAELDRWLGSQAKLDGSRPTDDR